MLDNIATGESRFLNFKLGIYVLNGTWLGYIDLGSQLSICPLSYKDVRNIKRFGIQFEIKCAFNINKLKKKLNELPRDTKVNLLYELYLED